MSSKREGSQSPRSITSSDTRRGSSSLSTRFHSKNRSQSAVSEPTRLSVPLEAISKAFDQNSAGTRILRMLVAGQIAIEGLPGGHAWFLQLDHHPRQSIHEDDQIRAAGVKLAADRHLSHEMQ